MTYVRIPLIAAGIAAGITAVFAIGGVFAVVALLVAGYVCFVGVILYNIREHGPADPPPVSPLRRRQLDTVCERQRVRR